MGASKRSLMRYRLIDQILTRVNHPFPTLFQILDYVNEHLSGLFDDVVVSKRTLQADINDMRFSEELGFFAPIEYHTGKKGYYYTEEGFSISKMPLKKEERQVIEFVANMLSQYENIPMFSNFKHITQKIFDSLNIYSGIENDELLNASIQFDSHPAIKGNNWLALSSEAIKRYKKLLFAYRPFGSEEVHKRIFHPYILKEFKGRWYLIGISEAAEEVRTYSLDRIEEMQLLEENYPLDPHFDRQKYFEYSFGIYNLANEEPQMVRLQFDLAQGYYVLSRPIHNTQSLVNKDTNGIEVSLKVFVSEDLIMEILSYGDKVKVLSPASLIDEIKLRIQNSAKNYL